MNVQHAQYSREARHRADFLAHRELGIKKKLTTTEFYTFAIIHRADD